eukprot:scaffold1213_cov350-Prasinococcus_capsulatus_cf.AAC.14
MKLQATIDVKTRQVSELTKKLAQQVFKVEQMELGAIGTKASDARVDELTAKVRELEEQLASPTREEAKADIAAANDQMAKDMLELQARNAELQAKVAKLEVQATSKPAKVTQSTGGGYRKWLAQAGGAAGLPVVSIESGGVSLGPR